jgi:hypothetical protein
VENPEPRAQYLNVVLRQIERTALRIPQFQREFVWDQKDVLELLESIASGYPIGSILTWKVDSASDYFAGFRVGPFPPADEGLAAFEVVLDGAQRLSSLYGCLSNPQANSVYRVAYDLSRRVFVPLAGDEPGASPALVPMSALFKSREFLEIQGRLAAQASDDVLVQTALELYSTFQNYQIPIIALASDSLEEVVEVFRRVNSTGTPLSPVDFVRALTWRSSFDLEETFSEFADRYEATPLAGLTQDLLIKFLAIAAGLSLDPRDVVRLKVMADESGGLESQVDEMRIALDQMAAFLERFSILGVHEVPYEVQRLILFSLFLYRTEIGDDVIETWFWRSTFAEEHQGKPESYVSKAVREIRGGHPRVALEVRRPVESDLLAERTRRSGTAVATGFELLMRRLGARSLLSGHPVSTEDAAHGLIFSRADIEAARGTRLSSGQLLSNVVLLHRADVRDWKRLRDSGTNLAELFRLCEERTGQANEIWSSQAVPASPDEALEHVLRSRSRELLERLRITTRSQ